MSTRDDPCPVPGCELKIPHVPFVTDFCHSCGGGDFQEKMSGVVCKACNVFTSGNFVRFELSKVYEQE